MGTLSCQRPAWELAMDVMKLCLPLPPPRCPCRYKGHVPGVASSFGSSYGNTTFKYFQDLRRTGLEKSYALLSGGRFPTIFSPNSPLVLTDQSQNWDLWLHQPTYSRFNLDNGRITELNHFYKVSRLPGRLPGPSLGSPVWPEKGVVFPEFQGPGETSYAGISTALSCSLTDSVAGKPSEMAPTHLLLLPNVF